jgi:signal peptidase I
VAARAVALAAAVAVVVGVGVFVSLYYIGGQSALPNVHYTASAGVVNVMLQEDPQNNSASKPDWVSYFVQDPATHQWEHTTLFTVPANTRVNVTLYGYDGCTPLRNNFWSRVQGTLGDTVTVQQFNKGNPLGPAKTTSLIDSWAHCSVGHTFAIPGLGLFVPVASPGASATLCSSSPCTPSSGPYSLEKFSFMTPKHAGTYRWQCFVPCGGGFLFGNGGPMQTVGYMTGDMTVVS